MGSLSIRGGLDVVGACSPSSDPLPTLRELAEHRGPSGQAMPGGSPAPGLRELSGKEGWVRVECSSEGSTRPQGLPRVPPRRSTRQTDFVEITAMTADAALRRATELGKGVRLETYQTVCRSRGRCSRELLESESGRWTWCPDCLTVYDDYGVPLNPVSVHQLEDIDGTLQ